MASALFAITTLLPVEKSRLHAMRTGNLAAVMRTMGHRDVNTAMHYQHPELEVVPAALDYSIQNDIDETQR